jgi:hypothetical protein
LSSGCACWRLFALATSGSLRERGRIGERSSFGLRGLCPILIRCTGASPWLEYLKSGIGQDLPDMRAAASTARAFFESVTVRPNAEAVGRSGKA